MIETPTRALRGQAPDVLYTGLLRDLIEGEDEWVKDWRDLLVVLAPYHDCARRPDLDPVVFLDAVAERAPEALQEIVRTFGTRTDVTPEAFGYVLTESREGLRYDWA